jgi:3',5'-cyclic AMP phosphodiesterase CpdA
LSSHRIALITDVHFGRIAFADIVKALVDDVNREAPDIVVVAGDLTQRARKKELAAASFLLDQLNATVVIPGNHDVFAWWFPLRRLSNPLARYRHYISEELDTEIVQDDVAILALNSSFGWTIKGGRFTRDQLQRAKSFFARTSATPTKLLVVHHHLTSQVLAFGKHDVARRGGELFKLALDWGVDAILSGHLHQSHARIVTDQNRSTVLISSGTATSDRGRQKDTGRNIYELITIDRKEHQELSMSIVVQERLFDRERGSFGPAREFCFEKNHPGGWTEIGA